MDNLPIERLSSHTLGCSFQNKLSHFCTVDRLYVCVCMLVTQSCPTLCNPMDCSPPGSSVHGILQARILEWVAISFSRGLSQPRDQTWVSCIVGRFFTDWATRKFPSSSNSGSFLFNLSFNLSFSSCISISGLGRSSREGHGNPLQYSCLENPMDRGAWQATVHRVAKNQT